MPFLWWFYMDLTESCISMLGLYQGVDTMIALSADHLQVLHCWCHQALWFLPQNYSSICSLPFLPSPVLLLHALGFLVRSTWLHSMSQGSCIWWSVGSVLGLEEANSVQTATQIMAPVFEQGSKSQQRCFGVEIFFSWTLLWCFTRRLPCQFAHTNWNILQRQPGLQNLPDDNALPEDSEEGLIKISVTESSRIRCQPDGPNKIKHNNEICKNTAGCDAWHWVEHTQEECKSCCCSCCPLLALRSSVFFWIKSQIIRCMSVLK